MATPPGKHSCGSHCAGRIRADTGTAGENAVCNYLKEQGFFIIARNVSFPGQGELDIVALKDGLLAFVEVRTTETRLDPLETVTPAKQSRFIRAARLYLDRTGTHDANEIRLDVAGVRDLDDGIEITYVRGAVEE